MAQKGLIDEKEKNKECCPSPNIPKSDRFHYAKTFFACPYVPLDAGFKAIKGSPSSNEEATSRTHKCRTCCAASCCCPPSLLCLPVAAIAGFFGLFGDCFSAIGRAKEACCPSDESKNQPYVPAGNGERISFDAAAAIIVPAAHAETQARHPELFKANGETGQTPTTPMLG